MTDRELMQQALEALKLIDDAMPFPVAKLAIKNLRERLAQPEHEPVLLNNGRLTQYADGRIGVGTPVVQELVIDCPRCGHCCPQRTWVGLTDEEIDAVWVDYQLDGIDVARAIEAKLKEKNT